MSSIWSKLINLAGNITGTLGVANGGTGLTSGTSGGVLGFTGSGTLASSGALTASALVTGGGAAATPSVLALGTANQVVGMNSGATANEYKTLSVGTAGTDFAITNAANSVTFNLPEASATARGVITTAAQNLAGIKTFNDGAKFATSGGTATALDYYETGSNGMNDTSAWTFEPSSHGASGNISIAFTRVGDVVTLTIPDTLTATANTSDTRLTSSANALVSRLRPSVQKSFVCAMIANAGAGVAAPGMINISSGGVISIYRDGTKTATWSAGTGGMNNAVCVTYKI